MSAPYDDVWICVNCGAVESKNPSGFETKEFLCADCEAEQAQDWLNHMVQMTERK